MPCLKNLHDPYAGLSNAALRDEVQRCRSRLRTLREGRVGVGEEQDIRRAIREVVAELERRGAQP